MSSSPAQLQQFSQYATALGRYFESTLLSNLKIQSDSQTTTPREERQNLKSSRQSSATIIQQYEKQFPVRGPSAITLINRSAAALVKDINKQCAEIISKTKDLRFTVDSKGTSSTTSLNALDKQGSFIKSFRINFTSSGRQAQQLRLSDEELFGGRAPFWYFRPQANRYWNVYRDNKRLSDTEWLYLLRGGDSAFGDFVRRKAAENGGNRAFFLYLLQKMRPNFNKNLLINSSNSSESTITIVINTDAIVDNLLSSPNEQILLESNAQSLSFKSAAQTLANLSIQNSSLNQFLMRNQGYKPKTLDLTLALTQGYDNYVQSRLAALDSL